MVREFADHASVHGGLSADLIRDVASDLRRHTAEVITLAEGAEDDPRLEADLEQLAHHIEACTTMIYEICQHRRAS
ncbi:hypothetical protein ACHAAC_15715 [Aeromicrobium sp. CF4.19]|uniref:hypothetical protein n=1 Tax=Aeromicrobium sp. CF4.19 TaxID=3373082 RepID=UPI003EE4B07C